MPNKIRVLIVDDHLGFRNTLREFLEGMKNLQVIGEAGNGKEAVALGISLNPDLVLMDIHMPEMDGKRACAALKKERAGMPVVLYSMDRHLLQKGCSEVGADRFVAKDDLFEELQGLSGWRRKESN